jgi:hypothetical protein
VFYVGITVIHYPAGFGFPCSNWTDWRVGGGAITSFYGSISPAVKLSQFWAFVGRGKSDKHLSLITFLLWTFCQSAVIDLLVPLRSISQPFFCVHQLIFDFVARGGTKVAGSKFYSFFTHKI